MMSMRWWAALCLCTAAAKEGSLDKFQRRQQQHLRKHTPAPTRAPTPVGPTLIPTTRMPTDRGPTQVPTTKAPAAAPNTDINVVVACSKAHYTGALAVVASATNATRSQRHRLRFLLLVDDAAKVESMGRAARCAIENEAQIAVKHFHDISRFPAPRARDPRLRDPLNYARFFVGELLPSSKRCIYLDTDVFVERSLVDLDDAARQLFEEHSSAVIAAVPRDFKKPCDGVVNCKLPMVRSRGEMHSFNAGVVVFDLDRWRSTKRLDSVARWISRNEASQGKVYKLGSNPPFVLAVGPDLARLDPRWNCMRGIHRQHAHNTRCWGGAFIRHYPGGAKPWDEVEVTRKHPPGWAAPWRFPRREVCGIE